MSLFRSLTMHQAQKMETAGAVSVQEFSQAMNEASVVENPKLGAFTHFLNAEPGLRNATGALQGFTAAIKANIAGEGWPTHCGSQLLANYCSSFDSTAIQKLRSAGCGFSGITTMDEFGMGSSCEHTKIGRVVNPWNENFSAGGSSGGSAAAVAAGLAWFALGSDTGGSVRLPAHFCGVVGLKPTYGRISRFGLVPFVSSLDTIGILARDVKDASTVFRVLAGADSKDSTTISEPVDEYPSFCEKDLKGVRIGVLNELDDIDVELEVRQDHQESMKMLEGLGAELIPVSLKELLSTVAIYTVLNCAEAASNLHRYDGSLYGDRLGGDRYAESLIETRTNGLGPEVKRRLLLGAHVLSVGYREQYYLKACLARKNIVQGFERVFSEVDVLALPTAPSTAFALGRFTDDPLAMHLADILTTPASLAGLPALTIPTSVNSRGLPHSLQLIGPSCSEYKLLQWARVLEKAHQFRDLKGAPWQKNS